MEAHAAMTPGREPALSMLSWLSTVGIEVFSSLGAGAWLGQGNGLEHRLHRARLVKAPARSPWTHELRLEWHRIWRREDRVVFLRIRDHHLAVPRAPAPSEAAVASLSTWLQGEAALEAKQVREHGMACLFEAPEPLVDPLRWLSLWTRRGRHYRGEAPGELPPPIEPRVLALLAALGVEVHDVCPGNAPTP